MQRALVGGSDVGGVGGAKEKGEEWRRMAVGWEEKKKNRESVQEKNINVNKRLALALLCRCHSLHTLHTVNTHLLGLQMHKSHGD